MLWLSLQLQAKFFYPSQILYTWDLSKPLFEFYTMYGLLTGEVRTKNLHEVPSTLSSSNHDSQSHRSREKERQRGWEGNTIDDLGDRGLRYAGAVDWRKASARASDDGTALLYGLGAREARRTRSGAEHPLNL